MKPLTDRERIFVELYIETGNATASAVEAGYARDTANAHRLVTRLASQINSGHQRKMARGVGKALSVLEDIIGDGAAHNRDRISAVSSYLDRAGVVRGSAVTLSQNETDEALTRFESWEGKEVVVIGHGPNRVVFPRLDSDEPRPIIIN